MHTAGEITWLSISTNAASQVISDVNTSMLICRGILWDVGTNLNVVKLITGKSPLAEMSLCISLDRSFFYPSSGFIMISCMSDLLE